MKYLCGLLLKIRFFLIRWLAGNDLQLAINCEVRGELILKRGYPGWVSDCLFTLADTGETQSDYPGWRRYRAYAGLMGITDEQEKKDKSQ